MQFGDDWPGLFIRGDNALVYAHSLQTIADQMVEEQSLYRSVLLGFVDLLHSCHADKFREEPA
jgi:hypothetical protein